MFVQVGTRTESLFVPCPPLLLHSAFKCGCWTLMALFSTYNEVIDAL